MKIFLLLLVFFVSWNSKSQYIPFPTDNAVWVNHHYSFDGWWPPFISDEYLTSIENFCVNNEDTIINSTTYTKLNYCSGEYRGAIRDNGGQVFFVSKDSLSEMLLYDFTANVGDTLTNVYLTYYWFDTLFVSAVSSINIGGQIHKIIWLEDENNNELPDYWIEGVGCSAGLLIDPFSNMNVSGWYNKFECFSRNDSIFNPQTSFNYLGSGSCKLHYLATNNFVNEEVKIYPNPANNVLNICLTNSSEFSEIIIYNTIGEIALATKSETNQTEIQIPITNLKTGFYFITLKNISGIYSTSFIKL